MTVSGDNGGGAAVTTIVVVPRQFHTTTAATVRRIQRVTPPPLRLVVVDGGSPRRVQRRLLDLARTLDFTLLHRDALLTPVEARNLALPHVHTELVAFVDNDTEVRPGWLAGLERFVHEHDADVVVPVVIQRGRRATTVHYAGGITRIVDDGQRRRLVDKNEHIGTSPEVLPALEPAPTECLEFHCALVRTAVLRRLAPLDELLGAVRDDIDFSLRLREAGHMAWLDPATTVAYAFPRRFRWGDATFFRTRWSDRWSEPGFAHFNRKWSVDDDGLDDVYRRGHLERRIRAERWPRPHGAWRLRIWRARRVAARALDRVATPFAVWRADRRRAKHPDTRVVHRASWDRARALH